MTTKKRIERGPWRIISLSSFKHIQTHTLLTKLFLYTSNRVTSTQVTELQVETPGLVKQSTVKFHSMSFCPSRNDSTTYRISSNNLWTTYLFTNIKNLTVEKIEIIIKRVTRCKRYFIFIPKIVNIFDKSS